MRKNCCSDSEILVLSGMKENSENLCLGIESLKESEFAFVDHQIIFLALSDIYKAGSNPGMEKIALKLKEKNLLDSIGGYAKLASCLGGYVACREDLADYINIVKDHALFRQVEHAHESLGKLLDQQVRSPASEIVLAFKASINGLEENIAGKLGTDFYEMTESFSKALEKKMKKETPEVGLSTGIKSLDVLTGGIEGGKLITIAARPGMGKTVLAVNMAVSLAKQHRPVYFFSIEMAYKEIEERIYSQISLVNQTDIHLGELTNEEFVKVLASSKVIDKGTLLIDDKGGIKIEEIVSKAKRAKEIFNISAVFIDYLQLINSKDKPEYRHLEIANYTRALKTLAKDLNIPVICLAQLSRKCEERTVHVPILSDLKESGAIEQDSDVVIAIDRRDSYDKFDRPGEAQVYVLKNRHGVTGDVKLRFDKEHSQFLELPQ